MAFQLVEGLKPRFGDGLAFAAIFFECISEVGQLDDLGLVVDAREHEVELALKMLPDQEGLAHATTAINDDKLRFARGVTPVEKVQFVFSSYDFVGVHK